MLPNSFVVGATIGHKYVVLRYTWADALSNDATAISTSTPLASDLILAALEWNGSVINRVDAASATKGFNRQFDLLVKNLEPTPDSTIALRINIAAGRFVYGRYSVSFSGGNVTLPTNAQACYHIIGINSSGTVVTTPGTPGASPSIPSLETYLPVCVVLVPAAHNAPLLMSDLADIRPFLTFSGVMAGANVTTDLTGLTNLATAGATMQTVLAWLNTNLFNGLAVDALKLSGKTAVTTLGSVDTTIPTSKAVKDYVDAQTVAAQSAATAASLPVADATYVQAIARVNFLIAKDVGMVSFFAGDKAESSGWLRCDGSTINKATYPKYAALVDYLKAQPGATTLGHPYYTASVDTAKLPNLTDRYIKDVGTSGSDYGTLAAGEVKLHTHVASASTSSTPSHTHTINHSHTNTGKVTGGADNTALTLVPVTHQHIIPDVPDHTHAGTVPGHDNPNWEADRSGVEGSGKTRTISGPMSVATKNLTIVAAGAVTGKVTQSVTAAVTGTHAHMHPIPATDIHSGSTGSPSTPDTHDHDITVTGYGAGTTNEVDSVALVAYIFFGMP